MGEFSLTHLLLLAVVVLIFFGPSRLPALGQSLGKAIRGFKSGLHEIDAEAKAIHDSPPAATAATTVAQAQLKSGSVSAGGASSADLTADSASKTVHTSLN